MPGLATATETILAARSTATRTSIDRSREVIVIAFTMPRALTLGWLVLLQFWILPALVRASARSPFAHRLDQLLVLLLPDELTRTRLLTAARKGSRGQLGSTHLRRLRGFARWRAQLQAMYGQGYQVASETIVFIRRGRSRSTSSCLETVVGAEGRAGWRRQPTSQRQKIRLLCSAYGLGAWPPGGDLTSLEQLLKELGVSQPVLRSRIRA